MSDYIIKKTDGSNGQFTIKPYTTNGPASPASATPLAAHAVSANTSLVLLGKGMFEYGELIASNFVHLTENFANDTAPAYPIQGQLWYKNNTQELFVYDSGSFTTQPIVINGKLTGNLNVNNKRIINVSNPTSANDAVNKTYADANYMSSSGNVSITGTLTIQAGGNLIITDPPVNGVDATNKTYVDNKETAIQAWANTQFVGLSGDTMTGNLTMTTGTHIVLNSSPTSSLHAVNKAYVDGAVVSGGAGIFAQKQGDIFYGPIVIDGTGISGGMGVISIITGASGKITVAGDYTALFVSGVKVRLVNNTGLGVDVTYTVSSSTLVLGNTEITVTDTIPGTASNDGQVVGSILFRSAPVVLNSTLNVTGTNTLNFGANTLTNIGAPTVGTDAATKQYVDTAISGVGGGMADGYLSGGVFNPTTNTITLSSTESVPDVVITGIASVTHTHSDEDVYHNSYAPTVLNSRIRQTLYTESDYPRLKSQTIINQIDEDLFYLRRRNNRFITTVALLPITGVSKAMTGNLNITGFTVPTAGYQYINFGTLTSGSDPTSLVGATTYTTTITVNGVAVAISILGSTASTFTDLVTQINVDLGGAAVATLDVPGKRIKVTSSTTGTTSTIVVIQGTLFDVPLANFLNISAAVNGIASTFTVAGDQTATFVPNTEFVVAGNAFGATNGTYLTISSTFGASTVITVSQPVPTGTTISGHINQLYGVLEVAGNHTNTISAGSRINVSSNTGGGDGNYYVGQTKTYGGIDTYIYMDDSTPLPAGTDATGDIALYSYTLPFLYTVETNKLLVHNNGVKQYKHTRGQSSIDFRTLVNENTDTKLANGSYGFNVALDGGSNNLFTITVSKTSYSVVSVSIPNNTWTVTGLVSANFPIHSVFLISGNTGIGASEYYTVKSVTTSGGNTVITPVENINVAATGDGTIRYPYTVNNLVQDINTNILSVVPNEVAVLLEDNNITFISTTDGSPSQVQLTNVSLFNALQVTFTSLTILNGSVGDDYAYSEVGVPLIPSNLIEFDSLPTVGNVIEVINTR